MALRLWLRYGRLLAVATAFLAVLLAFVAIRMTRLAWATSGGDPYSVPAVVDTNPDPNIVETTMVADEATVDIGNGVMARVQTFNGQVPGPEFKLKVGDTVIVHFENHLDRPTGIHWHGIELANASDGTPLTQNQVPPGGTFLYKFSVPRPGIYWYHPHHHSSTNQVFKGLYGPITITDPNEAALKAAGVIPSAARTLTLALSDITVCKAPGSNDARTYPDTAPWIGPGMLPDQGTPPVSLCETSPIDEDGMTRGAFAEGDVPNIQRNNATRENEGQTVLTNGKNVGARAGTPSAPGALAAGAETYDVEAGQGLRLQIGNAATIRFFRLRLTDSTGTQVPLVRIGGQGGLLDEAVVEGGVISGYDTKISSGEIQLDPGDRADVVAAIPASATGVLTLWTEDMERTGMGFSRLPTVPVAHFNVVGSTTPYTIAAGTDLRLMTGDLVPAVGAPTGTLLDPSTFTPAKTGLAAQDIQLRSGPNVDGFTGSHDFPGDYTAVPHGGSNRYAKLGDTLELTVTNTSAANHPFHMHGFSIQPISLTDSDPGDSDGTKPPYVWPYHEFKDNVDIPALYTLKFRTKLEDRALMDGVTPGGGLGRWVFHCHIFFHATLGMISEIDVVAPDGNEKPNVNSNATSVEVNEGQTAAMSGTSHDTDGDGVTFSASLGTVTPGGAGNWTWNYTTTDGPTESGFVYVTATDTGGKKDQVVFALKVDNVAPTVSITSPANGGIVQLATPFTLTAPFTDPGTGDTHTCSIAWGDATTTPGVVAEAAGSGTCTATHAYATAGFKTIVATVTDDDGGAGGAVITVDVNSPPDCTPVTPSPNTLWPANHKFQTVTLSGATDPDGDTVTLTVTGVTQDEPLNGQGDGDTAPDARLVPGHSHQVDLRSERSGNGDGRFYRVAFGGDDGRGGTCSATKNVTVVHSKGQGPAIESGLVVSSF